MKTEGTHPIGFGQLNLEDGTIINQGLSKREHFAAMAMNNYGVHAYNGYDAEQIAEWSVKQADALILALNK